MASPPATQTTRSSRSPEGGPSPVGSVPRAERVADGAAPAGIPRGAFPVPVAEASPRGGEVPYRRLVEAMNDGLAVLDAEHRLTYVNERLCRMLDRDRAELVGRPGTVLYHERDHARFWEQMGRRRAGEQDAYEITLAGRNGRVSRVCVAPAPIYDEDGTFQGSFAILSDVTSRWELERELTASRRRLGHILENTQEVIFTLTPDHRIGFLSPACRRELGFEVAELQGEDLFALVHPADHAGWRALLAELERRPGAHDKVEFRIRRRDGTWRWHNAYCTLVRSEESDQAPEYIVSSRDVHRRRAAEEATARARSEWERTFDAVPDLICIIDEAHRVTRVNRAMAERMGRPAADLAGQPCYGLVHGSCVPHGDCPHSRLLADGREHGQEIYEPRLDAWFDVTVSPLHAADGTLTGSVHVCRDITARKRAEEALTRANDELERRVAERTEALAEANRRLRGEIRERTRAERQIRRSKLMLQRVFDGILEPLLMVDAELRVLMLNQAAGRRFRVRLKDAVGVPLAADGALLDAVRAHMPEAGGEPVIFEAAEGDDRVEKVVIYPLKGTRGQPPGAIIRLSDVTRAKVMEKRLIHNEKLASLGLLISGIAHEINNPNNFITFNLPILRDYVDAVVPILDAHADGKPGLTFCHMPYGEFREDLYRLLENVEHGSHRISATVSGLKSFARKRDAHEITRLQVAEVCRKAATICRSQLLKSVRRFDVELPEDLPPIETSADALEQVLVNLLVNAAQAADKQDSWVRLHARSEPSRVDRVIVEVSDNGRGVDPKQAERIFDPFVTTKAPGEGTGLGLYICRSLIEGLGGRIEVESRVGEGSTFRVLLSSDPGGTRRSP